MNVTFRGVPLTEELVHYVRQCSDVVEGRVRGRARCEVVLQAVPAMPGRSGRYDVDIRLALPFAPVEARHGDPDPFLAVRGAFERIGRRLDDGGVSDREVA